MSIENVAQAQIKKLLIKAVKKGSQTLFEHLLYSSDDFKPNEATILAVLKQAFKLNKTSIIHEV